MASYEEAVKGLGGFLDDNLGTLAGIGGAWAIGDSMRRTGADAATDMNKLAETLAQDSAFKGYGVTTGLGTTTVGADGSTTLGVGPDRELGSRARNNAVRAGQGIQSGMSLAQQGATNQLAGQARDAFSQIRNAQSGNAISGLNAASQLAGQNAFNPYQDMSQGIQLGALQGLGGQQGNALFASQRAMSNAMQSPYAREQDIYNRAMAMQEPGLQRAQAAQQAREFAMGRGGVAGSQFGGTAEDAAMARARADASNAASFQAMNQAQAEMMNQAAMANQFGALGQSAAGLQQGIGQGIGQLGLQGAQLGQSAAQLQGNMANQIGAIGAQDAALAAQRGNAYQQAGVQNAQLRQGAAGLMNQLAGTAGSLSNSQYANQFLPMQQQMAAAQLGGQNADRAQTGQLTGTGYGAQLGLGGIQAQVNADKAASELYGNTLVGLMNAQAAQNAQTTSTGGGLFSTLAGLIT